MDGTISDQTPFTKKLAFFWSVSIVLFLFIAMIWGFVNEGKKDVMKYQVEILRINKGLPEPVHIEFVE